MARVLLTGMSDAGQEHPPRRRRPPAGATPTVDTDYGGWELPGATWDEPRGSALLAEPSAIAVSRTAQNQGRFYDRFEQVIYLRVPLEVLLDRVRTRTNAETTSSDAGRAAATGTL